MQSAQPTATEVIERWRGLERELSTADPQGTHVPGLQIEIQRQRYEYQRLLAEAAAASTMKVVARSVAAAEASRATLRQVRADVRSKARASGG